ncbi:hypothetical protein V6N11_060534 [Hibiscus sabdariffa]|uniref:Uncharacterized protein n=1 Tax=Hibiscus sabdariffa TaxID=183260 RepID=A0ABR2QQY0_9ROSI
MVSSQSSWFFPSQTHVPDSSFLLLSSHPLSSFLVSPSISLHTISPYTSSPSASTCILSSPSSDSLSLEPHDVPVENNSDPNQGVSDSVDPSSQNPVPSSFVPLRTSSRVTNLLNG